MEKYMDYVLEQTKKVLSIDSPTGYTKDAADYVMSSYEALGYHPVKTVKGGVLVEIGGEDEKDAILLEAHMDTLNLIKKYKPKGVIHCFSGSLEFANEVLKLGMYIGLGGAVTFKNAHKVINVVKNIPIDRILLETDAPYMSPTPFRGKRCDSSMIIYSAMKIAELKQINTIALLEQTLENAKKLFF